MGVPLMNIQSPIFGGVSVHCLDSELDKHEDGMKPASSSARMATS